MKPAVWLFILVIGLIAPVSAYQLYIDGPSEVYVGQPIKIMGNSTLHVGTSFDLVLYETKYTTTEIERKTITLQDTPNRSFVAIFSTRGLKGGQYKVETQFNSPIADSLSSDSLTLKLVNVLDRSGEITITAPMTQTLNEALRIEGSIAKLGDSGVKIEVRGPEGLVFGPTWVETKKDMKMGDGEFAKKVPVTVAGDYDVQFTDTKSYIGAATITVTQPVTVPATKTKTLTTPSTTRPPVTTSPPPPTTTQSPVSPVLPLVSLIITGGAAVLMTRKRSG